jgi:uncharacterized membrane protein (UPF0127 family)
MKGRQVIATLVAWWLLSAQTGDAGFSDTLDEAFGKDTLVISADDYACWFFDVYVASNRAQQMRGLMHVREMPVFTGMIFIYQQAGIRSMWMKNTYIPLDMLFIRGDGTVSSVIANTTPHSLETQSAVEPVNFVLELNAGMAERLSIGERSRILFTHLE